MPRPGRTGHRGDHPAAIFRVGRGLGPAGVGAPPVLRGEVARTYRQARRRGGFSGFLRGIQPGGEARTITLVEKYVWRSWSPYDGFAPMPNRSPQHYRNRANELRAEAAGRAEELTRDILLHVAQQCEQLAAEIEARAREGEA